MHTLYHELRIAVRSLRKRPVFSIVAIASIALGVGFNAAIFSGTNALLLDTVDGVPAADSRVGTVRVSHGLQRP